MLAARGTTHCCVVLRPHFLNPARFAPPCHSSRSFPYLSVTLLLPCALLATLGVQVLLTASVLVAWELLDSLNLVWTQVGCCCAGCTGAGTGGEPPAGLGEAQRRGSTRTGGLLQHTCCCSKHWPHCTARPPRPHPTPCPAVHAGAQRRAA